MKTIAPNIDELLVRYNTKDSISLVNSKQITSNIQPSKVDGNSSDMTALVRRIDRIETNLNNRFRKRSTPNNRKGNVCTHCQFINKQLGASLKTDHPNNMCGKKNVSISLLEIDGENGPDSSPTQSSDWDEGGKHNSPKILISSLQTNEDDPVPVSEPLAEHDIQLQCFTPDHAFTPAKLPGINIPDVSDKVSAEQDAHISQTKPAAKSVPYQSGTSKTEVSSFIQTFTAESGLPASTSAKLDKAESPRVRSKLNGITFFSLIDQGWIQDFFVGGPLEKLEKS